MGMENHAVGGWAVLEGWLELADIELRCGNIPMISELSEFFGHGVMRHTLLFDSKLIILTVSSPPQQ